MKFIIENAGAQRGYLLLAIEDSRVLTLEAQGDIDSCTYRALPSLDVDHPGATLARAVVSYVSRTRSGLRVVWPMRAHWRRQPVHGA